MAPKAKTWTCQRQSQGAKCGSLNPNIKRTCQTCGKPRPKRRGAAHLAVQKRVTYEDYIILNGGEHCGICKRTRDQLEKSERKLDRDHEHKGDGFARGLLCRDCNWKMKAWLTLEFARGALAYLERAEARR